MEEGAENGLCRRRLGGQRAATRRSHRRIVALIGRRMRNEAIEITHNRQSPSIRSALKGDDDESERGLVVNEDARCLRARAMEGGDELAAGLPDRGCLAHLGRLLDQRCAVVKSKPRAGRE